MNPEQIKAAHYARIVGRYELASSAIVNEFVMKRRIERGLVDVPRTRRAHPRPRLPGVSDAVVNEVARLASEIESARHEGTRESRVALSALRKTCDVLVDGIAEAIAPQLKRMNEAISRVGESFAPKAVEAAAAPVATPVTAKPMKPIAPVKPIKPVAPVKPIKPMKASAVERPKDLTKVRVTRPIPDGYFDRGLAFIERLAHSRATFTTDDVWSLGLEPHAQIGNVLRRALVMKLVENSGQTVPTTRPNCNHSPIVVWRSLVKKG